MPNVSSLIMPNVISCAHQLEPSLSLNMTPSKRELPCSLPQDLCHVWPPNQVTFKVSLSPTPN
ncbi:hypothetical protein PIB30_102322, partial [Stylosanthes scabra]|nr:hypothetical protein [Stylosanthes scabra]